MSITLQVSKLENRVFNGKSQKTWVEQFPAGFDKTPVLREIKDENDEVIESWEQEPDSTWSLNFANSNFFNFMDFLHCPVEEYIGTVEAEVLRDLVYEATTFHEPFMLVNGLGEKSLDYNTRKLAEIKELISGALSIGGCTAGVRLTWC